nr:hypothetical protein B1D1.360 [imported] - Neurospora crassa [Neurospora crassa]
MQSNPTDDSSRVKIRAATTAEYPPIPAPTTDHWHSPVQSTSSTSATTTFLSPRFPTPTPSSLLASPPHHAFVVISENNLKRQRRPPSSIQQSSNRLVAQDLSMHLDSAHAHLDFLTF